MFTRKQIALMSVVLAYGLTTMLAQAAEKEPLATNPTQNNPAQNNPAMSSMPARTAETMAGSRPDVDLFLIPCLISASQAEVALGDIAEQRAQSGNVKSFAKQMVKDHTELEKQARQLQDTLTKQLRPQNPGNTPVAAALFEIHNQIDQACLASARRALEQQSGADFDRIYIGMQVGAHEKVANTLTVFKQHATSPQLKEAITKASEVVNQHLEHAQRLWKEVTGSPQQAARKSDQQRQR